MSTRAPVSHTHSATHEVIPKQECSMSNGNEGHSRRQVLTTVGSLLISGAMGQAVASSSLVSPAAAAQPNTEIAEKTFEGTAEHAVKTPEAAYSRNRGKRGKHNKGVGAPGMIVGAPG